MSSGSEDHGAGRRTCLGLSGRGAAPPRQTSRTENALASFSACTFIVAPESTGSRRHFPEDPTLAAIVGSGIKRRPGRREIWVALGVTAVYGMAMLRMGGSPEERTHLFEYGIVAVLIYQALAERGRNGRRVPVPAALALVTAVLLGWLDEGIQALLPNRVYDTFDVASNSLAALIAIGANVAVSRGSAAVQRKRR